MTDHEQLYTEPQHPSDLRIKVYLSDEARTLSLNSGKPQPTELTLFAPVSHLTRLRTFAQDHEIQHHLGDAGEMWFLANMGAIQFDFRVVFKIPLSRIPETVDQLISLYIKAWEEAARIKILERMYYGPKMPKKYLKLLSTEEQADYIQGIEEKKKKEEDRKKEEEKKAQDRDRKINHTIAQIMEQPSRVLDENLEFYHNHLPYPLRTTSQFIQAWNKVKDPLRDQVDQALRKWALEFGSEATRERLLAGAKPLGLMPRQELVEEFRDYLYRPYNQDILPKQATCTGCERDVDIDILKLGDVPQEDWQHIRTAVKDSDVTVVDINYTCSGCDTCIEQHYALEANVDLTPYGIPGAEFVRYYSIYQIPADSDDSDD